MITLRHLTKLYPGNKTAAVQNISLQVQKGDVFGFLGPNGAGKTTVVKMLVGLLTPTSGSVQLLGSVPQDFAIKKRMGFLPEQPYFYQYLTAREFLQMCAEIFELPAGDTSARLQQVLAEVHLAPEAWDRKISTYSKGMQQRLGLAQALINDPELIILDEPMSGLDPLGRREVKDVILALKKQGKTVFFNSHILSDVEDLCNRIAIIDRGEIILEGTIAAITKKRTVPLEDIFMNALRRHRS